MRHHARADVTPGARLDGSVILGGFVPSRRITAAILALASAAVSAACTENGDDPIGTIGTGNDNTTVRFINATTGGTNLDIAENGTVGTGNSNIAFGAASSCTRVNNANPQLAVRTANSTTSLPGFAPSFTEGKTYTILVSGTTAAPVFTTLDDTFIAPTTGNAGVRIINATSAATPGAGNWDVYVNPTTSLGTPAATTLGRNSASAYLTVPAGQANTIRLTNAGSTTTLQNISVASITSGTVQTIIVGDAAPGSTALRTFTLAPCA
jgi:hypothetical protein